MQSVDGVLILAVSVSCITLRDSGDGLVVVPLACGIGAGLCISRKLLVNDDYFCDDE